MKKTITILLILVTCLCPASATSYAQNKIRKSTVLSHRTSFGYSRYSTGIGRQVMDKSDRRTRVVQQSDGRQEVRSYGYYPYWWYSKNNPYIQNTYETRSPRRHVAKPRRSVYTMTEKPDRVTSYQPLSLDVSFNHATQDFVNQPESYRIVSSDVSVGDIVHNVYWFGGSTSSGVRYGRTYNGESGISEAITAIGSIRPNTLASTTADGDAGASATSQKFGETPKFNESVPLGDAILPMLLLLSLLVYKKSITGDSPR